MRWSSLLALSLLACGPAAPDGPIDARAEIPDPPAGGVQFRSVEHEIPPLSERMFCEFFTWDGGDVGLENAHSYQDPMYGHHAILLETNVSHWDAPDGTVWDCTDEEDLDMTRTDQLYIPKPLRLGETEMALPDGMAVKLEEGQRLLLQSHYVNYADRPLIVEDGVNLAIEPVEDVQTWAAPYVHTRLDLDIPPGERTTMEVDCGFDEDVNLLFLLGHMHENGVSFSVDHLDTDGDATRVYDIPNWLDGYRDNPPIDDYAEGEFVVHAGEAFRTTCTWDNTTDETLRFPQEMCVTVGLAYPAEDELYCAQLF